MLYLTFEIFLYYMPERSKFFFYLRVKCFSRLVEGGQETEKVNGPPYEIFEQALNENFNAINYTLRNNIFWNVKRMALFVSVIMHVYRSYFLTKQEREELM